MYVCVCNRDVSSHLNYEHRVFHSEEFLKTREPAEQPFYKKVKADSDALLRRATDQPASFNRH